jgi:hypothetical protein
MVKETEGLTTFVLLATLSKLVIEELMIDLLMALENLTQIFYTPLLKKAFYIIPPENCCITLLIICPVMLVKPTLQALFVRP